jgi:hypothetical protein
MLPRIDLVLATLNDAAVDYLIVGGVAVVLHGSLRTTADLDLVVRLDRANTERAIGALEGLGYRPRAPVAATAFIDEIQRESWIRDKGMTVFSLWSARLPTLEIDLFVREPFNFDLAKLRATESHLGTTRTWIASIDDLIEMKRQAGRPKDLDDIRSLEALRTDD